MGYTPVTIQSKLQRREFVSWVWTPKLHLFFSARSWVEWTPNILSVIYPWYIHYMSNMYLYIIYIYPLHIPSIFLQGFSWTPLSLRPHIADRLMDRLRSAEAARQFVEVRLGPKNLCGVDSFFVTGRHPKTQSTRGFHFYLHLWASQHTTWCVPWQNQCEAGSTLSSNFSRGAWNGENFKRLPIPRPREDEYPEPPALFWPRVPGWITLW